MGIVAVLGDGNATGKSTVAVAIAHEWHERAQRAVLIDADPTRTVIRWRELVCTAGSRAPIVMQLSPALRDPKQVAELISRQFDRAIVDCASGERSVQALVLEIADVAIIPILPSLTERRWLQGTLNFVAKFRTKTVKAQNP